MNTAGKELLPNLAAEELCLKVDRQGIVTLNYVAGVAGLKLIINEPMPLASMDGKETGSTTRLATQRIAEDNASLRMGRSSRKQDLTLSCLN